MCCRSSIKETGCDQDLRITVLSTFYDSASPLIIKFSEMFRACTQGTASHQDVLPMWWAPPYSLFTFCLRSLPPHRRALNMPEHMKSDYYSTQVLRSLPTHQRSLLWEAFLLSEPFASPWPLQMPRYFQSQQTSAHC